MQGIVYEGEVDAVFLVGIASEVSGGDEMTTIVEFDTILEDYVTS